MKKPRFELHVKVQFALNR